MAAGRDDHLPRQPQPGHWDLWEARAHLPNGKVYSESAEHVYGEPGVDAEFEALWEEAAWILADVHYAADTFREPEPWLAVTGLPAEPRLTWRTTTTVPISYDAYEEHPAG